MSKKTYEMIAEAIMDARAENGWAKKAHDRIAQQAIDDVTTALAHQFEMNDERFNLKKFLEACGLKPRAIKTELGIRKGIEDLVK
jgi:hypothetical protein